MQDPEIHWSGQLDSWAEVVRSPDQEGITIVFVLAGGATLAPLLLSTWERWPRLQSGNRVGGVFLTSYLSPQVVLGLGGFEHVQGLAVIAVLLAIAVTALWWTWRGCKLDRGMPE